MGFLYYYLFVAFLMLLPAEPRKLKITRKQRITIALFWPIAIGLMVLLWAEKEYEKDRKKPR